MFGPVLPNLRDVSTCRGGSLSCNAILGGNWFWNIYAGTVSADMYIVQWRLWNCW